jgi:hypothetical protein
MTTLYCTKCATTTVLGEAPSNVCSDPPHSLVILPGISIYHPSHVSSHFSIALSALKSLYISHLISPTRLLLSPTRLLLSVK